MMTGQLSYQSHLSRCPVNYTKARVRKSHGRPLLTILIFIVWMVRESTAIPDVDLGALTNVRGFTMASGGNAVSAAGDINGDGVDDVVIGSNWAFGNNGVTHVIFGKVGSLIADMDLATFPTGPSTGFRILAAAAEDQNGFSVSKAGDVNGDGIDDIIIGARHADPSAAKASAGITYVIFGRQVTSEVNAFSDIQLPTTAMNVRVGFRILGAAAGDVSGFSVRGAGDVNGDGVSDVVVGAYAADPPGPGNAAGIVYVIFGRKVINSHPFGDIDLSTFAANVTLGFRIIGAAANYNFGVSVSGAGDVNGDGVGDIIVGAHKANASAGISHVIFGRNVSSPLNAFSDIQLPTSALAPNVGFRILGAVANDQSGYSVSGAGDVNNDGIDDVIIGAYLADPSTLGASSDAGIAYVVFGRDVYSGADPFPDVFLSSFQFGSTNGFRLLGATVGDYTSQCVSAAGDVNGDGIDDVIVGARYADHSSRNSAGISYVIYGRDSNSGATVLSDIDLGGMTSGSPYGFRILGAVFNDYSGVSVSGAGDINGDTFADVLVGTPLRSAYAVYGVPFSPTSQPSSQPSRQPSTQPTRQPSQQPSMQPTIQPSRQPTSQPSRLPSCQPTTQPTTQPSQQPSVQPTSHPIHQPSAFPSSQPTAQPTQQPLAQPSTQPSSYPTQQPSAQPSEQPLCQPSVQPSSYPSSQPTIQPTIQPSVSPSGQPTKRPSNQPSVQPSTDPSILPSVQPTSQPSSQPTSLPTLQSSGRPTAQPLNDPTNQPSVQPTEQPTSQPSSQPSGAPTNRPTAEPSTQSTACPTSLPSAQPSEQPSRQPSGVPSSQPTRQPSTQPTLVPTLQPWQLPSNQPSEAPSMQWTYAPSTQPSSEPSSAFSDQPSAQPTQVPTSQPSIQPRAEPTSLPSGQPSGRPSLTPSATHTSQPTALPTSKLTAIGNPLTDMWLTSVRSLHSIVKVMSIDNDVWMCGKTNVSSACVVLNAATGSITTEYGFNWEELVGITQIGDVNRVALSGRSVVQLGVVTSVIANCRIEPTNLLCAVKSFNNVGVTATTYVPYSHKIVTFGAYDMYTLVSIIDSITATASSFLYLPKMVKELTMSHAQSAPDYIGCFVVGTSVSATDGASYIVAGTVRSDTGSVVAIQLAPANGIILDRTELVNAITLEFIHPDSFIAGGLQLNDGTNKQAYLLRVNSLVGVVKYGVKFSVSVIDPIATAGTRRALSNAYYSSVSRGIIRMDATLYLIADLVHNGHRNTSSLAVLKLDAETGLILQQVHIFSTNASISCTDLTASSTKLLLFIACSVERTASRKESVIISVSSDLAHMKLPSDLYESSHVFLTSEIVSFKHSRLSVSVQKAQSEAIDYEYSTGNTVSVPRPSVVPTVQPSSAPSGQPSSSPSAAPSVSPQPTSQPSSSGPTNTYKPTAKPTQRPSSLPSKQPTLYPSVDPTKTPTARPTAAPSALPSSQSSMKPTIVPTRDPSGRPSVKPSQGEYAATPVPSSLSTSNIGAINISERQDSDLVLVVGGSVIGGVFVLWSLLQLVRWFIKNADRREKKLAAWKVFQSSLHTVDSNQQCSESQAITFPLVSTYAADGANTQVGINTPVSNSYYHDGDIENPRVGAHATGILICQTAGVTEGQNRASVDDANRIFSHIPSSDGSDSILYSSLSSETSNAPVERERPFISDTLPVSAQTLSQSDGSVEDISNSESSDDKDDSSENSQSSDIYSLPSSITDIGT